MRLYSQSRIIQWSPYARKPKLPPLPPTSNQKGGAFIRMYAAGAADQCFLVQPQVE